MEYIFGGINTALQGLCREILDKGVWRETRGQKCLEFPEPVLIKITDPTSRWCSVKERKWVLTLPYIESLHIALGRNDLTIKSAYVKNLENFSDDGMFIRADYGPRIRSFTGIADDYQTDKYTCIDPKTIITVDQFKFIEEIFKKDPYTRQGGITFHDPGKDCFNIDGSLKESRDHACNRIYHLQRSVEDKLNWTTYVRSNDCFVYETKIPLLNGEIWEIGKLAEEKSNEEFWVYSRNEEGKIVAGKAHHPRKIKKVKKIIKVTLDNGEIIKCTPDHKFMLKDGSFKEIKNILLGESLAPLYKRINNRGYEEIFFKEKWHKTYIISYESVFKSKDKGNCIHHKDFNKCNNDPHNLIEMEYKEHILYHSSLVSEWNDKLWNPENPEYFKQEKARNNILKGLKRGNDNTWKGKNSEKNKENQSKIMSEVNDYLWNGREGFREYMESFQKENIEKLKKYSEWLWHSNDEEAIKLREEFSKNAKDRMNEPENKEKYRKITSERNIKNWKDPEYREKMINTITERQNLPENKIKSSKRMAETSKKLWGDPEYIEFQKKTQKIITTEHWKDPEYREKGLLARKKVKRNQVCLIFKSLENKKIIINEENYEIERKNFSIKYPSILYINKEWGNFENAKAEILGNHKIISVEFLNEEVDVYDITVDKYHNFALDSGIFVHNCIWGFSAVNIFNHSFMQEYWSSILNIPIGNHFHFANNLHVYDHTLDMVKAIAEAEDYKDEGYEYKKTFKTLEEFDKNLYFLEELEEDLRVTKYNSGFKFEDPFFSDWHNVFIWKWTKKNYKFHNHILQQIIEEKNSEKNK